MTKTLTKKEKQVNLQVQQKKTKKEKPVEIFTNGNNSKIADIVSIINLPPIITCTNCATCAGSCYANFRYQYPNVNKRWNRNWECTKADNFVEKATIELQYKGTPIVRFHESGDFYSDDYIDKCFDLAVANPNVFFYGYTKNKKALKLNALANVNIIYSLIETPIGEVRNYGTQEYCEYLRDNFGVFICPHDNTWKNENKRCMTTCDKCKTLDKVCFIEHGRKAKKDPYPKATLEKLKESKGN